MLKEPWCKIEEKSLVLNESTVNCAVNCIICTSLYNFSSLVGSLLPEEEAME